MECFLIQKKRQKITPIEAALHNLRIEKLILIQEQLDNDRISH
jgi:hypothetical protein